MINSKITPNELQNECIKNTEGKYLVLAGPGTGKTFTLIQRIAYLIKKGTREDKILCLTFSDAAANEMRTRLLKELNKTHSDVSIYTYHSFCNEIINNNLEDFSLGENTKLIPNAVSRQFIKECIDEIDPKEFRSTKNDPYVFLETILRQIEEIKKNRLTKETFFNNLKTNPDWEPKIVSLENKLQDYIDKNKKIPDTLTNSISSQKKKVQKAYELWEFYELYKNKMELNHYIDYNDMINFVLERFELEPHFLDETANKYEYILVDEYQDTNKNQNDVIFNLTKALKTQNIFVVGDDDQIIYTFQGAKLDTIEKFLINFPDTRVICLKENMRSNSNILNSARALIKQDLKRLEINPEFEKYNISKELISKNTSLKNNPVRLNIYNDINQEYLDIVNEIASLINSCDCPKDKENNKDLSQIAVLLKSNDEIDKISKMLKDRNIPFEIKEGKNIFEIKSAVTLYYYLKMLVNDELYSDSVLKLLTLEPFNINPCDYTKILLRRSSNKSFINSIEEIDDFIEKDKIDNFINTYKYLKNYKNNEVLRDIVLETGAKTGIFDYYLNSEINQNENISAIKKIIDEANDFSDTYKKISLEDFIEYLDLTIKDNIVIKTDKPPVSFNAVQLSTYHSAKGREFDIVYMPSLIRQYWEGDRSSLRETVPTENYKTDDELKEMKFSDKIKLMYVGFTRAKETLRLSYFKNINLNSKPPSQFISKIEDNFEVNSFENYNINSYMNEIKSSIVKRPYDYKRDFKNYIDAYLNNRHYSPSAIKNYIDCPRMYLYNNVLNIQSKYSYRDSLCFGSSIHKALEKFSRYALKEKKYPKNEYLIDSFKNDFNNQIISSFEQKNILLKRGMDALCNFYNQLINVSADKINEVEYQFNFETDNYKFTGIIDRIDINPDGTYSIYDYKTGSAKPISKIAPDEEYESYYNQLGLYKYFFEKKTNKKVKDTTIVFVEEPDKNIYLDLNDEDCDFIIEKFKTNIDLIKNHNFEPSKKESVCKYCSYKDFCRFDII